MSSGITQKESNKITLLQQQMQQQHQIASQQTASCAVNGGAISQSYQQQIGLSQNNLQMGSSLNSKSPLLSSSIQQRKISQKIQLKVPLQTHGQPQPMIGNTLMNGTQAIQQNNQLSQGVQQSSNTLSQQQQSLMNGYSIPSAINNQQQHPLQQITNATTTNTTSQCTQNYQLSSSTSSVNSSYSVQSQLSSQNSLQSSSLSSNINSELQQASLYQLQNSQHSLNHYSLYQQPSLHHNNITSQLINSANNGQTVASAPGNGSGQNGSSNLSLNCVIPSISIKKPQGEENGINISQKKKLLQIIQKQQREQQEFEKQQQQAIIGQMASTAQPQTPEEIMQEITKNHKRTHLAIKPLKVITSPKTKKTCIRDLLKKYQRNKPREENSSTTVNQNTSSATIFMAPQLQINSQSQANCTNSALPQSCISPLKRPTNGMCQDEKFIKYSSVQTVNNNTTHSNQDISKEESIVKQEQIEYIEDCLQDNFDQHCKLFDEDELAFMKEIEDVCIFNMECPTNDCGSSSKVLYNKSFNQQAQAAPQQQSISSGISPSNTTNSKQGVDNLSANSLSQQTKENDCPKVKDSNFKRLVKPNVSISAAPMSVTQTIQSQSNNQNQKSGISQMLNWFDNSFEKKNNTSNSEFFQGLETEDSLATTQLTALSSCTPNSINQNLLNLFSPQTNSSSSNSTINFSNTNNSLKQAIQSIQWQNGEGSQQVFEQIKQQIDQQKQQLQLLQQSQQTLSGESDISSGKQLVTKCPQDQQQIEKKGKVAASALKNSIQPLVIENQN